MRCFNGAYGVTVNTEVCGTFDSGSIPDRHPKIMRTKQSFGRLYFWRAYRESKDGGGIQDEESATSACRRVRGGSS